MIDLDDTLVVLSDSNISLVEELRSVRDFIKTLKAREKEIRSLLLKALSDASLGITASGKYLVEVTRHTRTGIDADRLQALYEDVWADVQVETEVETLRFVQEDDQRESIDDL